MTPTVSPRPGDAPPGPVSATVSTQAALTFFDADVFDTTLGQTFDDQPPAVHVAFAAPTSLNAIPPRMNVWLSEIKKSNGRVMMQSVDPKAGPGTRGLGISMIFDIIDAIITWQERAARSRQLASAHSYDATIVFDKTTGAAKEVLFQRRGA